MTDKKTKSPTFKKSTEVDFSKINAQEIKTFSVEVVDLVFYLPLPCFGITNSYLHICDNLMYASFVAETLAKHAKTAHAEYYHPDKYRTQVKLTLNGVSTDRKLEEKSREADGVKVLPDLLAYLQKETELTRHTLVEILKGSGRLKEFNINPQQFMTLTAWEISRALHDLMLDGIQYEKIANHYWEMHRIKEEAEEGIVRYLNNLYEVQNPEKCLFDQVEYDSEVEKQFAIDPDNNEFVRLFVKLPSWFKIDTPIGSYNPDWAFVTHRDEKLYFVRETKIILDDYDRRTKENQKIKCGERHFETIDIDYAVVTKLSEVNF